MPAHDHTAKSGPTNSAGRETAALNAVQLAACCLGVFLAVLNQTLVATAMPDIQHQFRVDHATVSWVIDGYTLTLAGLMLLSGSLCDRFGRRRILLVGLGVFAVGALGCALSTSLPALTAMRVLQAVGGSLVTPATLATVTTGYAEPEQRTRAVGIWSAAVGLGISMGPLIGGVAVEALGWPSVFWLTGACAVLALGPAWSLPSSGAQGGRRRVDVAGQLSVFGFLIVVTYAVIHGASEGWGSRRSIVCYLLASALAATLVLVERRAPEPVLDPLVVRDRVIMGAAASVFLVYAAMMSFIVYTALGLQQVHRLSAAETGLALVPATLPSVLLGSKVGRIAKRFGTRTIAFTACAVMTCALAILARNTDDAPIAGLSAGYLLLGTGFALFTGPVTAAALGRVPPERAGVASATLSAVRQVGNTLGVAVVGAMVQSRLSSPAGSPLDALARGLKDGYLLGAASTLVAALTLGVILTPRESQK
jgi:EmrB/QacA subfamily drug resistance transporter